MNTSTTPLTPETIRDSLVAFLESRTRKEIACDLDIFESGMVSSLFAMELLVHIESSFGIEVPPAELRLDHFRTVDAMTGLVLRLAGDAGE